MSERMMEDHDPLLGKALGHCTIQRKLGQGGMGAVYLAHHPGLNRPVAIKVLPGDLASNPEYRERFFREARLAAWLESWEVQDVELRVKQPGARVWPHATVTATYEFKLPRGTLRTPDQTTHWVRRLDGRWLLTRLLKSGR